MDINFNDIISSIESYKKLGYKVTETYGTKLYGHLPKNGPDAWLHEVFQPLSLDKIRELEEKINKQFNNEFASFLQTTNGLMLFNGELAIYGYRDSYNRARETRLPYNLITPNTLERPKDSEEEYLFIGGYSFDGSMIYINLIDNKVFHCSRSESKNIFFEWNSLLSMLKSEFNYLRTYFDKNGYLIDENVDTTRHQVL